jgi:hypothetical protein
MPMKPMLPICRACVVDQLAGVDTAPLRLLWSLASGRNGNTVLVSARAMHIGSDYRKHWRALASITSLHATMSIAANEQSP